MPLELEIVLRLLLAAGLGAVIGFQRGKLGKPAGLRDNILICLGAALFTVASVYGFVGADAARVAAGIVTGIGFLGAGTILRRGEMVEGVTTAATIWVMAAIGLAAGAGLYLVATAATGIVLGILYLPSVRP
ncbi:MAG: MgtC/SapB family protein [Chloroflexi bacterium]|nr:MgtC/SapB family protein [Chloroflexota bacterium]